MWANFALSAAANAPNRLQSHRWPICCSSAHLLSPPLPLLSYLSLSLVRPHFVAVAAVAIGRCPVLSYCCRYCCIVDCWIVHAADATPSASYSLLSLLQPHFCAHPPPLIFVFASPSSSEPLSPGTWARGRWRGRPLPSSLATSALPRLLPPRRHCSSLAIVSPPFCHLYSSYHCLFSRC